MGYCGPSNYSGIDRGSGCILSCLIGLQDGEVRQETFGLKSVGVKCFSDKYIWGHGGFKVIVDGVYGVFFMEN